MGVIILQYLPIYCKKRTYVYVKMGGSKDGHNKCNFYLASVAIFTVFVSVIVYA